MEKTIMIDETPVKFKATAQTPRLYRQLFQRELFDDIQQLQTAYAAGVKEGRPLSSVDLTIFENIAFTMAKDADPEGTPETADEWLEGFGMFSVWSVLPEIVNLWGINSQTINKSKKKAGRRKGS